MQSISNVQILGPLPHIPDPVDAEVKLASNSFVYSYVYACIY